MRKIGIFSLREFEGWLKRIIDRWMEDIIYAIDNRIVKDEDDLETLIWSFIWEDDEYKELMAEGGIGIQIDSETVKVILNNRKLLEFLRRNFGSRWYLNFIRDIDRSVFEDKVKHILRQIEMFV